jgi:ketosteroid isomerase-like protein
MPKAILFICILISLSSFAQSKKQIQKDIEHIRAAVVRTGQAFNERQPDTIMSFYSPDIIVSYPGVPDTRYDDFAKAFAPLKDRPANMRKTRDSIEEIIVSGDLAVVRVNWITTTYQTNPDKAVTRVARDMQIWKRQKNGQWKFFRGMWFHEKPREN